MKFNIAFLGPERIFNLRRDFILLLKYTLEDLGHTVRVSGANLESSCINLLVGAYFLNSEQINLITKSKLKYININTEVISNDMLNFNPDKVDFINAYLPMMKAGIARWDVILDNIDQYPKYDTSAYFLRWGYHSSMQEINHDGSKDLDYYFFGMLSERRKGILNRLKSAGLKGIADHSCPYFVRNDRISRAKINLNLVQDNKYSHVNSFRICYLLNNNCHIISELENDPADYLKYVETTSNDDLIERLLESIQNGTWREKGINSSRLFKEFNNIQIVDNLLHLSFSQNNS
jgi:hypothetical protein